MGKLITDQEIKTMAKEFGLTYKHIKTVQLIEASGGGYDAKTGKIKIQFEPHVFHRELATKKISSALKLITGTLYRVTIGNFILENKVDVQSKEWEAFEKAKSINEDAAYRATSFGLGQICGFNCKLAGFKTAKEMADAMEKSEYEQLKGMLNFIKSQPGMFKALLNCDWATFARLYNGPAYKKFNYDTRLKETYDKLKEI